MDKFPQLLKALLSKLSGATRGIGNTGATAAPAIGALAVVGGGAYGLYHSVVTGRK